MGRKKKKREREWKKIERGKNKKRGKVVREVRSCSELPTRAGSRSPRSAAAPRLRGPGSPLITVSAALHRELSLYRPKCSLRGRRAGWGAGISPSVHSRRIALPSANGQHSPLSFFPLSFSFLCLFWLVAFLA